MRGVFTFGDFALDASKRQLTRNGEPVPLSEHQVVVLLHLVSRPGDILTKSALIDAAWEGVAVTDNSLEQAVSSLRRALGASQLIETVPRRGYRFRGSVTRAEARVSDDELNAILAPHRALVEGRAALETLERPAVERAARAFEMVIAHAPDHASAHLGLANAYAMQFESTRADESPDADALTRAGHHAHEACRLDPHSGDAWATLALVLHHTGLTTQAIAAARRAVSIEPDNWRHHLRLAYVAWGEERLRAAHRTLALFPGFPIAHLLAASVYVARQAFDLAEQELRTGAAAQDAQRGAHAFRSVGCHWLLGLVHAARADEPRALETLHRELAFEAGGQLYARECASNTWYAIGALQLRAGRASDAAVAFDRALERVPSHLMALIGSFRASNQQPNAQPPPVLRRRLEQLDRGGRRVEIATGRAALAINTAAADAAAILEQALGSVPAGNAGWLIPVDPLLNVTAHEPVFASVLARLRSRAG